MLQQLLLLLLLAMVLLSTRMVLMCVYSLLWFLFWSVSFSSRRGGKNTEEEHLGGEAKKVGGRSWLKPVRYACVEWGRVSVGRDAGALWSSECAAAAQKTKAA